MDHKQLTIVFTDSAQQELNALVTEMELIPLATYLGKAEIPNELRGMLGQLLSVVTDLFSTNLPDIQSDPEKTLRTISRDINLARILRERGLFRLYRLVRMTDEHSVPVYMSLINPISGSPFSTQEEFIGWFCEESHVARSLAFMRLATIERTISLGFELEESFHLILSKPYAIRETLNMLAEWKGGNMESINPDVAIAVSSKFADQETANEIKALAEEVRDGGDTGAYDRLMKAYKPVVAGLLREVGDMERSKDALDWVKHDVLIQPVISYTWDHDAQALVIELIKKQIDPENGTTWDQAPIKVPFIPDALYLPDEIKDDLLRRLPIRNRLDN